MGECTLSLSEFKAKVFTPAEQPAKTSRFYGAEVSVVDEERAWFTIAQVLREQNPLPHTLLHTNEDTRLSTLMLYRIMMADAEPGVILFVTPSRKAQIAARRRIQAIGDIVGATMNNTTAFVITTQDLKFYFSSPMSSASVPNVIYIDGVCLEGVDLAELLPFVERTGARLRITSPYRLAETHSVRRFCSMCIDPRIGYIMSETAPDAVPLTQGTEIHNDSIAV
jgi:hypothetical protein